MPHNRNAKKALRQSEKNRLRNRAARSALKSVVRKVHVAVAGADVPATEAAFRMAAKRLDQAASKDLIHKNKASRLKSRLSRAINKAKSAGATAAPAKGAK